MKNAIQIGCTILFFYIFTSPAFAAKPRIRTQATGQRSVSYSTAKLSRPSHSVIVTFQNLASVKRASYELTYMANGVAQGAMGTVQTTGLVSDSRTLYFGTCSHGVCTPHYNISNATLTITTSLTTGTTNTKRYRIKI